MVIILFVLTSGPSI